MKTLLLSFILSICSLAVAAQAQYNDSVNIKSRGLYLGVNLNTTSFHIYYEGDKLPSAVRTGYFEPISVTAAYQLTERLKLQVGVGAGGDKDETELHLQDVKQSFKSKTIAFATPVSVYLTFLKIKKKLPVYGVVALVPAYGITTADVKITDDEGTRSFTVEDSGINVFTIAGVGFNYKISQHFYGNVSYFFYKTNLTGPNSFHYDWDKGYGGRSFVKSLELGLNYNFNLKREK